MRKEKSFPVRQNDSLISAGNRLRTIREQKGMSQEDLAFEAGVDQSTLSKVERLGPHHISWAKFVTIAEILNCTIDINFLPKN